MDQYELERLTSKIPIAPEHLLREYYEMAVLQAFSESNLSPNMIFYGGTSLRLCYGGPRFSEDLDFLMTRPLSSKRLKSVLEKLCKQYRALSLREVHEKRNTLFALLRIHHPAFKHARHIKIEISRRKNGISSEYRLLRSECSAFTPLIRTITLESLEKLKISAIFGRNAPRDWADLWIIANFLKKPFHAPKVFPFDPKEFRREMKRFFSRNQWKIIDQIIKSSHETT